MHIKQTADYTVKNVYELSFLHFIPIIIDVCTDYKITLLKRIVFGNNLLNIINYVL